MTPAQAGVEPWDLKPYRGFYFAGSAAAAAGGGSSDPVSGAKSHERHMKMQQMIAKAVMAQNGQRGLLVSGV